MIVPIVASISRELLVSVPTDLKEGAMALGATRWEMVRGVALPQVSPGLVAAVMLGLGRAMGEAVAVSMVIGNTPGIHLALFDSGATMAGEIVNQYAGAVSHLQQSSLEYLAVILLAISVLINVSAQMIVRRINRGRGLAR